MVYTRRRMTLCLCLIGLMLAVIWGNSLLNANLSSAISRWVGSLINNVHSDIDATADEQSHGILRKIGHITEFAILGTLVCWLAGMRKKERWQLFSLPLLFCLAVACVDETIQLFVPGRAGRLTDVGIDTLGAALGIVLITLIQTMKTKFLEETRQ